MAGIMHTINTEDVIAISDLGSTKEITEIDESCFEWGELIEMTTMEADKSYTGYIPYINGKLNHYECFCGNKGVVPDYINKSRFVCPNCGNYYFINTNAKRGFNLDLQQTRDILRRYKDTCIRTKSANLEKKPLKLNDDILSCGVEFIEEDVNYYTFRCICFSVTLDEDLKTVLKQSYKYYKVSKVDFLLYSRKNKEKPKIISINEQVDTYKQIEKLIISKLEYPLANYTGFSGYYNVDQHISRLKILTSKAIYQIHEKDLLLSIQNKDSIRLNINLDGTNIEDILRLPKTLCNLALTTEFDDKTSSRPYLTILLDTMYTLHKDFGIKTKPITYNTEQLRNLIEAVFVIIRCWNKVLEAENALMNIVEDTGIEAPVYGYGYRYGLQTSLDSYDLAEILKSISKLVRYGYNLERLTNYLTSCYEKQGIYLCEFAKILEDYARMNVHMGLKYDKYPDSVKLNHDLIVKKYRLVKNKVKNTELKAIADKHTLYEIKIKDYAFVLPRSCHDFIKESNVLRHCVSSYTEKVFDGDCIIVFMRKAEDVTKPFVTIEVVDGCVRQVKGFSDRKPSPRVIAGVKEWCDKLNLAYRA